MASGTTGTMRGGPGQGGYLADLIARWLGGGGGGSQGPQSLFPPGVAGTSGMGGTAGLPPLGSSTYRQDPTMFDDYGGGGPIPLVPQSQGTTYGRGHENYAGQGTPGQNVPRAGVSPAPVPGVNAGVPGTRPAMGLGGGGSVYGGRPTGDLNPAGGYGGAGSAQALLAAILGGGGRY